MTMQHATMRAATLYDVHDLRVDTVAIPELEPGDMLVRIAASGICSGDLMPWYIRRKAPLVLGHEPVGVVCTIGSGRDACDRSGRMFRIGDRVAIHHHAPCLQCRACLHGDHVQCLTWKATRIYPGGIAEYVRVPVANLLDTLHLPQSVAFEDAVLVEPLGCVIKSLRRARLHGDAIVYVVGLGVMGLLHVALVRERNLHVYGSDYHADRRTVAQELGADAVFEPETALASLHAYTDGRGADVVVCGPGNAQALQHAVDACAPGGSVIMFTPLEPGYDFIFDQSSAYFRDISLISSYSCGPDDTAEALAALERGVVGSARIGAKLFPLEHTAQAYDAMMKADIIKSIITF